MTRPQAPYHLLYNNDTAAGCIASSREEVLEIIPIHGRNDQVRQLTTGAASSVIYISLGVPKI